jgi:hypothetical protein
VCSWTLCAADGGDVLRLGRREECELRKERGIGFEDIVLHIERGDLLDILERSNPDRYAASASSSFSATSNVCWAPFDEDEHTVFLKTIISRRKATKQCHR